ncbi:MAG TPA: sigma-70 family RNA polymerase sigma factor [Planctomycetota bacterium]|nr:sigma-70 family RNA polymerase sigma factor [Planctomycetota bacterium]
MPDRVELIKAPALAPDAHIAGKPSDESLMQELANGSHHAFEELLTRYETPVITFCYAFLRNREAAEDIAQESFMRVFRNAKRYQPVAKFTTWLYKIAANLCINELKKGKLRATLSLDEPAGPDPDGSRIVERIATDSASPLSELERLEAQALIGKAIEHLPPDQRTTLVMVEYHQMQYQDIAEILEVSVSAIKMRVKRARETLRETLKMLQGG